MSEPAAGPSGVTPRPGEPMSDTPDAWRAELCECSNEPQHIHCPWGGAHVHYVDDQGSDVPPPDGHKLKAVFAPASSAEVSGG